jgi:hypothetical protein
VSCEADQYANYTTSNSAQFMDGRATIPPVATPPPLD